MGFGSMGSMAGSGGASLSADRTTYLSTVSANALIAALSKPFGAGTTYAAIGTVPAQLALSNGMIVAGGTASTLGATYPLKIRATSADGKREAAETLMFTAALDVNAPKSTVTISSAQSKPEGNNGANLFTYTVTRSASNGATSVPWSFTAGSTAAGDFTGGVFPAGGSVALADGVSSSTFSISVAGDTTVESDETFTVLISTPAGYAAGAATSATGIILNDDAAATYLPTLTTSGASYHAVHSSERLISTFSGPTLRANNGTTQTDIGATGSGVTTVEVATLRGSTDAVRFDRAYDQSGNGRTISNTTMSELPALREDVLIGGKIAMAFDGRRVGDTRGMQPVRLKGAMVLSAQDFTYIYVLDPTATLQEQFYWEIGAGATRVSGHIQGAGWGDGAITMSYSAGFVPTPVKMATVPQVIVIRSSSTNYRVNIDGALVATLAAAGAATTDAWAMGSQIDPNPDGGYCAAARWAASVAIDKDLNDADVAAITTALMTRFAIPTTYDAIEVTLGNSRDRGGTAATVCRNVAWYERASYGGRKIKTYNFGLDGQALSAAYANRATYDTAVYVADIPVVYKIGDGINDLGGLGASTDAATIYANTITPWIAYHKALGVNAKSMIKTTLPYNTNSYSDSSATVDARRVTFNGLITGNVAAAHAVSNVAGNATIGTYPTSPNDITLYPDKLHPSSLGYSYEGPIDAATLLTVMP